MKSNIAIEYIDNRLSKNFGVIHRDRANGHVIAHHYPSGKRLVWTEANGTQHYVSEYDNFDVAMSDWTGRCKASQAAG